MMWLLYQNLWIKILLHKLIIFIEKIKLALFMEMYFELLDFVLLFW